MSSKVHQKLIQAASKVENTPELQSYWYKRYKYILDNSLFEISERTQQLVNSQDQLSRPATVFGSIILPSFLKGTELDEQRLQSTIETATRLLDSCLDIINFDTASLELVKKYRKIGIGISQFDTLLAERNTESEIDNIDLIGALVSSYTYRASESLAEEKGVCTGWNEIEHILRPKVFEYWYNEQSSEIKNGLELAEEFDQQSITSSGYSKIRRRNSDLLIFPHNKEWEIWNDRVEPTQSKNIIESDSKDNFSHVETQSVMHQETTLQATMTSQDTNVKNSLFDTASTQQTTDSEEAHLAIDDKSAASSNSLHFEPVTHKEVNVEKIVITELQGSHNEGFSPTPEHNNDKNQTTPDSIALDEHKPKIFFDSGTEDESGDSVSHEISLVLTNDSTSTQQDITHEDESDQDMLEAVHIENDETETDSSFDEYQIGELVYVDTSDSEYHGHIYQIGDVVFFHSQIGYKLIGNPKVEDIVWKSHELKPAELDSIIQRLNHVVELADTQGKVCTVNCVITKNNEVIVDQNTGFLPIQTWDYTAKSEQLSNSELGLSGYSFKTIGAHADTDNKSLFIINISSDAELQSQHQSLALLKDVHTKSDTDRVIIDIISRYIEEIKSSQHELNNLREKLEGLRVKLQSQESALSHSLIHTTQQTQDNSPHHEEVLFNAHTVNHYNHTQKGQQKVNQMYTLKLEQQVKTNAFGDVNITFIYDRNGIQINTIETERVDASDMIIINSFVSLINAILNHGVNKTDICEMLIDHIIITDSNITIMQMLHVIAAALAEVPSEITSIQIETLNTASTRYNQKLLTSTEQ